MREKLYKFSFHVVAVEQSARSTHKKNVQKNNFCKAKQDKKSFIFSAS
jgi:hypothetical protein